ncbi:MULTISPECIES: class I SAM-dependent methyltransferase [Chitinophagaceae]
MAKNNYDTLAPFYDLTSRAVYGQALVRAQRSVLQFIKDGQKVLIVGGGTGWVLDEIEKLNRKNITVTYIEASAKMVALSRKKSVSFPVEFICAYAEETKLQQRFDVLMTPFFFDNFSEEKCLALLDVLDGYLKESGMLLYVDFRLTQQNMRFWKKMLLKTMYLFFHIFTKIETNKIVDMASILEKKYVEQWSQFSFHEFVFAAVYSKNG